jgi:hypothetical protein
LIKAIPEKYGHLGEDIVLEKIALAFGDSGDRRRAEGHYRSLKVEAR